MILRRIVARSMQEALDRVEREVGPDALLIDCRQEDGLTHILARHPEEQAREPKATAKRRKQSRRDALLDELRASGMSAPLLRTLLDAARGVDPRVLDKDSTALRGVLRRLLHGLLRSSTKRAQRVAVVGPTGVGKTTTIAKLAARDALTGRVASGIITTDTYRVAAVEQLRAFAEMIDVPFRVAFTPQDLRRALEEMQTLDRVWIDTSGRSPRDKAAIRAANGYLQDLDVETCLCLPAAGRRRDLEIALDNYAPFDPRALVVSKLDETEMPGELLSLAVERDLPIAGHGCGQRVPEDWEDADRMHYAHLLIPSDARLEAVSSTPSTDTSLFT